MKKRILASLMALCLLVGLLPTVALASETQSDTYMVNSTIFTEENLNYRVTDATNHYVMVQSVSSVPVNGVITIPAKVTNGNVEYTVVGLEGNSIGRNLASSIESVSMPGNSEAFTTIGDAAFQGCTSITSLTIPASVTKIGFIGGDDSIGGFGAFDGMTALTSVTFAEGSKLETLGSNTFSDCSSLTTLELPSGLKKVGTAIVEGCTGLSHLTIPASVENMSTLVFGGYYKNENGQVNVSIEEGGKYRLQDGILYYDETSLLKAYEYCETVVVPEGITTIGAYAFASGDALNETTTSLTLPNSLSEIGAGAFTGCTALETVDFQENTALSEIPEDAFVGCSSLKEITVPKGVKTIGSAAFGGCTGLETIVLPEGLTSIGESAFLMIEIVDGAPNFDSKNEKIKSINIPSTVTSLGEMFLGGINESTVIISMVKDTDVFTDDAMAGLGGYGGETVKPTFIVPEELKSAYTDAGLIEGTGGTPGENTEQAFALDIPDTASVEVNKTVQLNVTSTVPTDAKLVWSSSNEQVATVVNGTITGVKAGSATITASIQLNGITLVSDSCVVTVSEVPPSTGSGGGGSSSSTTYAVSVEDSKNGSVSVSPKRAEKGDTVTVTVKPDSGYALDKLTVTDKNGDEIKLTEKADNKFTFKMPASRVEIEVSFKQIDTEPEVPAFADVHADAYYADAVAWAVKEGITSGTSATTFSPNASCTRAQIVTFLWRAAGSPEPKSMSSFSDVSADSYYAKAVAWAVENGITTGTGDGKFSPDATCTRAQSVTFLFRAIGKLVDSKAEFSDVLTDSYYANAVAWAVENGVTNGIGNGLFGPDNSCTRAQIVTFLFRAYQGK